MFSIIGNGTDGRTDTHKAPLFNQTRRCCYYYTSV